jgi:hypothetical protein
VLARLKEVFQEIRIPMNSAPQTRVVASSLRALLDGLIDYAGLFPPASLSMTSAVVKYAGYLAGENRWALGRFIVPVGRLEEFQHEQASLFKPDVSSTVAESLIFGLVEGLAMGYSRVDKGKREYLPWRLSIILGTEVESELDLVAQFNRKYSTKALIDVVELKASSIDDVRRLRPLIPESITPYFEIPADSRPELFHMLAALNVRAKIRTGGVVETAFPSAEQVAQFISRCAAENLPFKATAGLHHPLRCVKPLTYRSDAPTGMMHGFLNLFLAACAYREHREQTNLATLLVILLNDVPEKFRFQDEQVTLDVGQKTLHISTDTIRRVRQNFAISFGSCSFEEPIEDLRSFHLL